MLNPITAVTAENPSDYYADLVKNKPFYYDDALAMWIASGSQIVESILANDSFRVRPAAEPVPKILLDTTAGRIFRHLVRMNDGETHCPLKMSVSETIDAIDVNLIIDESEKNSKLLIKELYQPETFAWINDFAFRLPVYTMSGLLGLPQNLFREIEKLMSDFVRCITPGGTDEQLEKGKAAAEILYRIFEETNFNPNGNLFSSLNQNLDKFGVSGSEIAIANSVGFLFQTYEATAGMIGNSLVNLAARPPIIEQIKANPDLLKSFIDEVNRFDPSIQNTRRFVAADIKIAGEKLKAGAVILVILAAANRDRKANRNPEKFELDRQNRRSYTFGAGAHACSGQNIALKIAGTAVGKLIFSGVRIDRIKDIQYRTSANSRIPLF